MLPGILIFSGLCLDIEKAALPAKCLFPIIYATLKVVCKNILMISLCGSSNNILIATLTENSFVHAGPQRQKWVRSVYTVYN